MSTTARRFAWLLNTPAAYHATEQAHSEAIYTEAQRLIAGNY